MYGDGFRFLKFLYRARLSPFTSKANFLDNTTWKISPSWMYCFALFTMLENSSLFIFGITSDA